MTTPLTPGAKFREALATSNGPLLIPGAFNALTARMAQQLGFRAVYQSGATLSAGWAGVPDIGLLTQTEFAGQGAMLTRAVNIPVISDADTGFGPALSVERTVQLYESAGLAGLHLEDQQLPKRCGHLSGKSLVETSEMVSKLKAAVAARHDADFIIIARTDARSAEGMQAALDRAKAYIDAGADMIFPEALETPQEFETFAQAVQTFPSTGGDRVPLLANMTEFGKSPLLSRKELGDLGYAAMLFPVTTLRVAMKAVEQVLTEILQTGTQQQSLPKMQTREELYRLLAYEDFDQRDRSYFSGGE